MAEPGGLLEPAVDAVKSQSTLDTGPIHVSDARRAQLAGTSATKDTPVEKPATGSEAAPAPESVTKPAPPQAGDSGVEEPTPPESTPQPEPGPEPELATELEPAKESLPSPQMGAEAPAVSDSAAEPEPASDPEPSAAPEPTSVPEPASEPEPVADREPDVSRAPTPESTPERKLAATETPSASEGQGVEQDVAAAVLPGPPSSDREALEALNRLPRNAPPAAGKPNFDDSEGTSRCRPGDEPSRTPLSQLAMSRWGSESGKPYAILATPTGEDFRVDIGDRLGPHGGLVVEIDTAKVTVFELRLDAEERAQTVREVIKKRP